MKKSLMILSMLAVAGVATAQDQPVAGSAEAPNYYIIKANRGVPYLGYSEAGVAGTNGTTHLCRTNGLTTANVWAVTAGTAEGSLVIKNYTADAYLLDYFNAEGSTLAANATANTVSTPTDIFTVDMGGAYALNVASADGAAYPDNCLSLDAPGGTAEYCGNYIPTAPSAGEGSCWWFTKVTVADGQTMEQALIAIEMAPVVAAAVAELQAYAVNVPEVASQLNAGIAAIKAVAPAADYATKIAEAKEAAIANANTALGTVFANGTYALKNLRRAVTPGATDGAYLTTDVEGDKYAAAVNFTGVNSAFEFKSNGNGGYTLYNAATKTYVGNNFKPVTDEASAQVFYPVLVSADSYSGMALCINSDKTGNGLNHQSWLNGAVSFWSINDAGSIWSPVNASPEALVAAAAASVKANLNPYIANVPMAKDIIEKAISDANALTYSAELDAQAAAITAKAIEDVNALLATGLNNKVYAMKYVRGNDYLNIVDGTYAHAENGTAETSAFTFKAAANGGYTIYNASAGIYVGPVKEVAEGEEATDLLTQVTDEAAALVVYPVLVQSGEYYGVALCLNADKTGNGINMNANTGLHAYSATDPGSVWGLIDPANSSLVESIGAAEHVEVTGIYDLSGRKLSAPVKGSINIINGKKVLVK